MSLDLSLISHEDLHDGLLERVRALNAQLGELADEVFDVVSKSDDPLGPQLDGRIVGAFSDSARQVLYIVGGGLDLAGCVGHKTSPIGFGVAVGPAVASHLTVGEPSAVALPPESAAPSGAGCVGSTGSNVRVESAP